MPSGNNSSAQGFAQPELDLNEPEFEILQNATKLDELKFRDVELKDFLGEFVIGVNLGGEQLKSFTLLPPTVRSDRELGLLLKRSGFKIGPVMNSYLPRIIDTIGGYPIQTLASELKASPTQLIQNMAMGDLMLLILNARINARGGLGEPTSGDIQMAVKCPQCGKLNKDTAESCHDLKTINVKVPPHFQDKFIVEVTLEDGFKVGKDLIKRVYMEPLKLHHVTKLGEDEKNPDDVTALISLITEIPDSEDKKKVRGTKFFEEDYDNLSMKDLRIMRKAMRSLVPGIPGPEIKLEMACINCRNEWEANPQWADLRSFLYGFDEDA